MLIIISNQNARYDSDADSIITPDRIIYNQTQLKKPAIWLQLAESLAIQQKTPQSLRIAGHRKLSSFRVRLHSGGGCEIRTHGRFPFGSFQDCWFKPLTQTSKSAHHTEIGHQIKASLRLFFVPINRTVATFALIRYSYACLNQIIRRKNMEFQTISQPGSLALEQNKVLRNTYTMLALTMIPTIIGAFMGLSVSFSFMAEHPIMAPLMMFGVMMGMLFAVSALRNSVWGIVMLLGFTFVAGFFLGPILQHALHLRNGAELVGMAAGGTGLIFFSLATVATVTKKDFSFMGKFLFIGVILLIVASLANIFFAIPALSLTISAIAVLIFSAYILYDISQIIHGGETNYVMATMGLYLNIYNIFVNLLSLLMAFTGERD
jgi:modulator of FtsH protease